MAVELRQVELPDFGIPTTRPVIPTAELEARCDALLAAAGTTWAAVYADREHFGNLTWLTGYDPRFEEALLLLGPDQQRVLLVGIEGIAYAEVAGLPLDVRLYHPFSILGQPHVDSPPLRELLTTIGLRNGDTVGLAGWKLADPRDVPDPTEPCFVPAFLPKIIDAVTGTRAVEIAGLLLDPAVGIRNRNSAAQIALYEWGAARDSAAVLRVVRGVRPGMTELEAAGLFGYQGEPVTMHPIVSTSDGAINGLRSATDRVIGHGDAITAGLGYWGGLSCRAGIVAETPDDAYWRDLVEPYFRAIATWWSTVGIGVPGGDLVAAVSKAIGSAPWESFVNAGHLTSYEEWTVSFSRAGNTAKVVSGMAMQCDIIPTPLPLSRAINCEDSLAIADEPLRAELAAGFPEVLARIEARRTFMRDQLGITLRPEVLPLSYAPAYLPPCWLAPDRVCVLG